MGVDFGHLAGSAAFDVFCDVGFHVWPPVIGCDELEGFGDSRVASGFLVMKKGNYLLRSGSVPHFIFLLPYFFPVT